MSHNSASHDIVSTVELAGGFEPYSKDDEIESADLFSY